jgi:predicted nucleotidyltransferase
VVETRLTVGNDLCTLPSVLPPSALSASESAALSELVAGARAILGSELKAARLFGSRARGEGHERSDLDVALVVRTGAWRAYRHRIYDLAFDVGLAHGVELAPLLIEEPQLRELRDRERRIAHDIDEGLPL